MSLSLKRIVSPSPSARPRARAYVKRRLCGLLHDVAQLAGQDQVALAGHNPRLDEQHLAPVGVYARPVATPTSSSCVATPAGSAASRAAPRTVRLVTLTEGVSPMTISSGGLARHVRDLASRFERLPRACNAE